MVSKTRTPTRSTSRSREQGGSATTMATIFRGLRGHPGTPIIVIISLVGYVSAGWMGFCGMLTLFVPFYLLGAYERGRLMGKEGESDAYHDE